jgi:hypothetical protein
MIRFAIVLFSLLGFLMVPKSASAHCDTTRGPVVTAARAALDAGNSDLVLHWVQPADEAAVRAAFQHTLQVRALGPEAKALADRYFFETLVRIHRAGERAPYTGLNDSDPEPIIAATDRALELGSAEQLERELVNALRAGLAERFAAAQAAKNFQPGDVAGGREFVATYVPLTHWVEAVFAAATATGEHHATAADHAESGRAVHQAGQPEHGSTAEAHDRGALSRLPWLVAGLLAIAALVEGAFLIRHKRTVPA